MPEIIRRVEWGAAPPRRTPTPVEWEPGGPLWVHYSAGPPPIQTRTAEARTVQEIQRFHQGPTRGWNDVGYAYLVAPSGRVYEGRGRDVLAAHCPGHNAEASVCLLWQSGTDLPPQAALDSVLWLREHLDRGLLMGHREGTTTSCPGDAIMTWVARHRTTSAARPVGYRPPWMIFADGRQIARARLTNPVAIRRIARALHATGHRPPYTARLIDGAHLASGQFWPPGDFTRRIARALTRGSTVTIDGVITIKPRKD